MTSILHILPHYWNSQFQWHNPPCRLSDPGHSASTKWEARCSKEKPFFPRLIQYWTGRNWFQTLTYKTPDEIKGEKYCRRCHCLTINQCSEREQQKKSKCRHHPETQILSIFIVAMNLLMMLNYSSFLWMWIFKLMCWVFVHSFSLLHHCGSRAQ